MEGRTMKWKIATAVSSTIALAGIVVIIYLAGALNGFQEQRDARNCRDIEIARSIDPISGVIVGSVNDDTELVTDSNKSLVELGSLEARFRACNLKK